MCVCEGGEENIGYRSERQFVGEATSCKAAGQQFMLSEIKVF